MQKLGKTSQEPCVWLATTTLNKVRCEIGIMMYGDTTDKPRIFQCFVCLSLRKGTHTHLLLDVLNLCPQPLDHPVEF